MSILVFLAELPVPVVLALIGCTFVLLLLLLILVVFVPLAAERIGYVMDILLRPYYAKKRLALTIVFRHMLQEVGKKEENR
jgi:hypothetical protein